MLQDMIYQNLVAGSFGTLVALTEITLKVLPKKILLKLQLIYIVISNKFHDFFNKLSEFK